MAAQFETARGATDGQGLSADVADITAPVPTPLDQVEVPEIAFPKSGGALRGIDETFKVMPTTGTASLSLPLPMTPGRGGLTPPLGLSYSSGAGNGPFGMGWSLDMPRIARRTDKAIPRYRYDTDTFVSGGEELVPWLNEQGPGNWVADDRMVGMARVRRYRARTAGDISRIERIDSPEDGTFWKVTSGTNAVTYFGRTPQSRIADPNDASRVFEWLPDLSFDDRGNAISYEYKVEDLTGIPQTAGEAHRLSGAAKVTNRYLKRVRYGNMVPYFRDTAAPYAPAEPDPACHFQLVFDYGDHDAAAPAPLETPGQTWPYRADATSTYRQGFEVRTSRLCRRVLMFHSFPDEPFGSDVLVRALELDFTPSSVNGSGLAEVSYLTAARMAGFLRRGDGTYARETLPEMTLRYQNVDWDRTVRDATGDMPAGLSQGYRLVDLDGLGAAGVLRNEAGTWVYHPNLGPDPSQGPEARFGPARTLRQVPEPVSAEGALSLHSLDGDGTRQAVLSGGGGAGYFELSAEAPSDAFTAFRGQPPFEPADPNVRAIDLAGDGRLSLLLAEETALLWSRSAGRAGYLDPERVLTPQDAEGAPRIVFSEPEQTIFLADMSGDGLTDIVEIRNGSIGYWSNLGYGRFGARIRMTAAPRFAPDDLFDPTALLLADLSGTGTADLIYTAAGGVRAWLNLAGTGWSAAHDLGGLPPQTDFTSVTVADLTGNGTPCLAFSSVLPGDQRRSLRYMDLLGGRKAHLLSGYDNGIGLTTELSYRSSTRLALEDAAEGRPWATRLPFPIQVVEAQTQTDAITGARFTTRWRYAHGAYDPAEKEFRGFGRVDQTDSAAYEEWRRDADGTGLDMEEAQFQAPVLTRAWYDLGLFEGDDKLRGVIAGESWQASYARAFPGDAPMPADPALADPLLASAPTIFDPDPLLHLRPADLRAAARATRGRPVRTEVFALDGDPNDADDARRRLRPYTVTQSRANPMLIQPGTDNQPPVFMAKQQESLTQSMEREPGDPRLEHVIVLETDEQGNVLEQAEIAYGRDPAAAAAAFDAVRDAASDYAGLDEAAERATALADALDRAEARQTRDFVTITRSGFTNDITSPADWRRRQLCQSDVFEITGLARAGALYAPAELRGAVSDASTTEIAFEAEPGFAVPERRRTEATRALYRDADLITPLPLGQMVADGVAHESYVLALTSTLIPSIFEDRIADPDATLVAGGYVQLPGSTDWWLPSGHTILRDGGEPVAAAQARFLQPVGMRSSLGAVTRVGYRGATALLMESVLSPVGNVTRVEEFDLRTLSPTVVRDANDNLAAALYDELGRLRATASLGKDLDGDGVAERDLADDLVGLSGETAPLATAQATVFSAETSTGIVPAARDLIARASVVYLYDDHAFAERGIPAATATIARERHHADDPAARLQVSFTYSDGSGAALMTKDQADPGGARVGQALPNGDHVVNEVDTAAAQPPILRWVGSGRVIRNNKGHAVRRYEPYFSATPRYEDAPALIEVGVSAVVTFDPLGRPIRTDMPDGTFSADRLGIWQRASFDAGDTVLESRWHAERVGRLIDAELQAEGRDPVAEEAAARASEANADTPKIIFSDALGRGILMLGHDGFDGLSGAIFAPTTMVMDVEGNTREIHDPRGNRAALYRHDLAGRRLMSDLADSGARHELPRANGAPYLGWDARGHVTTSLLDPAERPVGTIVEGGDGPQPMAHRVHHIIHGEGQPNDRRDNLRGHVFARWDGAGREVVPLYDRLGNPRRIERRFAADYRQTPDWSGDLEGPLEAEVFATETDFDALGRTVESRAADGTITRPTYGAGGHLERMEVAEPGQPAETVISAIDHDAKGQRMGARLGNSTVLTYSYAADSFRLISLTATKANGDPAQGLRYTYDAMGNPTEIRDRAVPIIFFDNQKIEAVSRLTYDPRSRLVRAEGREHAGQAIAFGTDDNWRDLAATLGHQPGDQMAWRSYTQRYRYDGAGNIRQLGHTAQGASFTRDYDYAAGSNRLVQTRIGAQVFPLTHHAEHGFVIAMPHLSRLDYDHKDRMVATARQAAGQETPETTYYVYDYSGARVRKVTEAAAPPGQAPGRREERITIGALEYHRVHLGAHAGLERRSLSVSDGAGRVALIDRRNDIDDGTPARITRYQLSNQTGSAVMEMDAAGRTLNYEEYHPFGTTAYRATDNSLPVSARRFRYARERDEESGLYHMGARYYAPWLCRWCAPDPEGLIDGLNLYAYVGGNPIRVTDPTGTSGWISWSDLQDAVDEVSERIGDIIDTRSPLQPRDTPMTYKEARKHANKQNKAYRAETGMKGAEVQSGHTLAPRHAPDSGISEVDADKQRMQQLHSRKGKGLDVEVTDQQGVTKSRTRHTAQEGIIDDAVEKVKAANGDELTPRGQLDAAEEVHWRTENVPMDQRDVEALRQNDLQKGANPPPEKPKAPASSKPSAPDAPSSGAKVAAKTGDAVDTASDAAKKSTRLLKAGAKLGKAGRHFLAAIPVLGIVAGHASAAHAASEGDYTGAALDEAGFIPVAGDILDAGRGGYAVGEAITILDPEIERTAMETGAAAESAAKWVGLDDDTAVYVGAGGAAVGAVAEAAKYAIPGYGAYKLAKGLFD